LKQFYYFSGAATELGKNLMVFDTFRNVSVILDSNVFAANKYDSITFKYRGGQFWFEPNQELRNCTIEMLSGVTLPENSQLHSCAKIVKTSVDFDAPHTIGQPLKLEVEKGAIWGPMIPVAH
jgi:hypothetical protein